MNDAAKAPEIQRDVQRLLGRCMLRIQQYEQLVKVMLAGHKLEGTAATLKDQQQEWEAWLSDKSLGTLAKTMFDSYFVVDGAQQRELLAGVKLPSDQISMAFRFSIAMPEERRVQYKAAIDELVAMRNDLVHHLIERFDLWDVAGCEAAIEHLTEAYQRIDTHYIELRQWARGMDAARTLSAAFMESTVFQNVLVNGVASDGTFDWARTGIVSVLREGLRLAEADGWASLDAVRQWAAEHHPEQTPGKYHCRSWPQVIHESGQFELQNRLAVSGGKVAWYRSRTSTR